MTDQVKGRVESVGTTTCTSEQHDMIVTFRRDWRWLWLRKRYLMRCWHCGLRIEEP